jgi:hypothetical protein
VGLLAGAKVPLILRDLEAADKCFELVGSAYVNGVMYGEGMIGDEGFEIMKIR